MERSNARTRWDGTWLHVALAALVLTSLNALKPVHNDDAIYLRYATEFAAHPLEPYAFSHGIPYTSSANLTLVPPVLPYWLALGIHLLGNDPTLLKWWLLPFAVLLAGSFRFLALRFAPSLAAPLIWLGAVSTTTLPGFDFMLDVPVLALGMTAVSLAIAATERDSWGWCMAAGLVGGLAIQTKYTGIVPCVTMLAWFVLNWRPVKGVVAFAIAIGLAVGWEFLLIRLQGTSHFGVALGQRNSSRLLRMAQLLLPMFSHMAGLAPATALLAWGALGWSRRSLCIAAVGVLLGIAALAASPTDLTQVDPAHKQRLTVALVVYVLMGLFVWSGLIAVCCRLAFAAGESAGARRVDWLLLFWLAAELGGCFVLSPFPAARRLIGAIAVLTLIAGRAADRRHFSPWGAGAIAAYGVALALLLFVADLRDAEAQVTAAVRMAKEHAPAAGQTVWSVCWTDFGYAAERLGMPPLQLDKRLPRVGDLVALRDDPMIQDALLKCPEMKLTEIDEIVIRDDFPLKVFPNYYAGGVPLRNQDGERCRIRIYRVDWVTDRR
jgi:Dolichyl-phosphate-mannose-protein mannosyltransferase